ncbi:helix-turn-helix domain-containing protein [Aminicella lysinilytica]|uniref:Helix-turn-helix protein n=1 Tax=Aminicella lysinilytica TaxID=433323 RepID=A0A4R6PX27_9FIRM|nr:helix-turn-helix transcriptional regulator [Aminicella lysinilytica]NLD11155.1 helix-turn-helix transcriptional regulator [Clostridiales bacterium]TDP49401.1 helix-turn-helix protein [Aminicella lysinilytica]
MDEINIGKIISRERKARKITQEDLAEFAGVSKASVSKWENGMSYPDVTLLPELAAFFNISIDELMNYSPQMTTADIRKLYREISDEFSSDEFDAVFGHIEKIAKKYYSCFPLLMQLAILLLNHCNLAGTPDKMQQAIDYMANLCRRIIDESGDARLCRQAESILAMTYMMQNRFADVVDLLCDEGFDPLDKDSRASLLAKAYTALGKTDKARMVLQSDIYTSMILLLSDVDMLIAMPGEDAEKVDEYIRWGDGLIETFDIKSLNFNSALIHLLSSAAILAGRGDTDGALQRLTEYTDICCKVKWPISLHGNKYFDTLDESIKTLDLSGDAPRSEKLVRDSMADSVIMNPAFGALKGTKGYEDIVARLSSLKEE